MTAAGSSQNCTADSKHRNLLNESQQSGSKIKRWFSNVLTKLHLKKEDGEKSSSDGSFGADTESHFQPVSLQEEEQISEL